MLNSIFVFLSLVVACTIAFYSHPYYHHYPECRPLRVKENIPCNSLGQSVPIGGGLYQGWELHYNPLFSVYYGARFAEALGYERKCPTNRTFLAEMQLMTPWSGQFGAIAIDGAFGYDRLILRRCVFPTGIYPFLCTGSAGNPPFTDGTDLRTLSYISLLHDDVNHRWTLFGQCWNAKTPERPNSIPTATSWNVFSLDPELPPEDFQAIIAKLDELGFSTAPENLIQPNYTAITSN